MLKINYLILTLFSYSSFVLASAPMIKVRIAHSQKKVDISGTDIEKYLWPKKRSSIYAGYKEINFNCQSNQASISPLSPIRLASLNSKTGILSWGKSRFKGRLHVQTSEKFSGCDIINEYSLEDYLPTLLAKEMNTKWPIEALKAQAVAARSYALFKIRTKQVSKTKGFETNYDLENSEKHQVSGSFFDATEKTILATKETAGKVLVQKNGSPVPVFFHSKCGGKTLRPDQVWENRVPGYSSVSCPFCHKHGRKNWKTTFSSHELSSTIRKALLKYKKVSTSSINYNVLRDHQAKSRIMLYADDNLHTLKKSRLRGVVGRDKLPSNYFVLKKYGKTYQASGSGFGHGVGLCQFGAKQLALMGYNYKQILNHYFPKMALKKIY